MLECEELILDALTLHQGVYTLPGWINVSVVHVIFFNDVALKHAHLKELIECHLLRSIVHIEHVVVVEDVTALRVIQPKQFLTGLEFT